MSSPLSERTKQRRRLLKAAAGVPAIVVLPVGAQSAASSLNCIAKGIRDNDPPVDIVDDPDQWVRREVFDANNQPTGTYQLQKYDTQPVAYGTCWNSIVMDPKADPDTNLIP